MAEDFKISAGTKEEKYRELQLMIRSVTAGESDPIANMANVASMLHETFGFWWTGFYRVIDGELVLGPFQGPLPQGGPRHRNPGSSSCLPSAAG